jgi:hypothetical protein
MLVQNRDDLLRAFAQWKGLVLKPVYSRFASRTLILPPLREVLSTLTYDSPWVAQEFVAGQQFCTYSVCQRGQITAHATYPTIFTAGQGATIAFESVDHPAIFSWVKTFVERFGVTGQMSFDFIQSEDGLVYALECNPRATSGAHLLASHPQFADAFLAERVEAGNPIAPLGDKKMLASAMLVYGLPSALKKRGVKSWARTFLESGDVIWQGRDPLPSFLQFRSLLFYMKLSREKGISPLEASTFDIEWNGER